MSDREFIAIVLIVICAFGIVVAFYRAVTGETKIDRAFAALLCGLSTYAIGATINKVWGSA